MLDTLYLEEANLKLLGGKGGKDDAFREKHHGVSSLLRGLLIQH